MTNVEAYEAGQRMDELIDTVIQGTEVTITHFGEPVAVIGMRCLAEKPPKEAPPPGIRDAIANMLADALEQLCGHLDPPSWRLN